MFYFTYVLKSQIDNKLYVGWTNNLQQRIKKHNDGKVQSTKSRKPLKLVYFEGCLSEQKAISREKYFKTGFGRRFLKSRV
jgi:putative endonuclease